MLEWARSRSFSYEVVLIDHSNSLRLKVGDGGVRVVLHGGVKQLLLVLDLSVIGGDVTSTSVATRSKCRQG